MEPHSGRARPCAKRPNGARKQGFSADPARPLDLNIVAVQESFRADCGSFR